MSFAGRKLRYGRGVVRRKHRAEKWIPIFRKAMRKKTWSKRAIHDSRTPLQHHAPGDCGAGSHPLECDHLIGGHQL